ncbi:hypothetical protein GGX14DRAFT_408874 [Mycena pura]|uniref:DUF6533 domain-containing protein n=1 Tax=Mycena pura TaxID=153505 RepID=A0AAD6Y0W7_9AGAR|nr:hypothetical protein GGX14DRAFT_408874 [Mycena pura]
MGRKKHFRLEAAARVRQSRHFSSATIQYSPIQPPGPTLRGRDRMDKPGSGQKVQFSPIQVSPEGRRRVMDEPHGPSGTPLNSYGHLGCDECTLSYPSPIRQFDPSAKPGISRQVPKCLCDPVTYEILCMDFGPLPVTITSQAPEESRVAVECAAFMGLVPMILRVHYQISENHASHQPSINTTRMALAGSTFVVQSCTPSPWTSQMTLSWIPLHLPRILLLIHDHTLTLATEVRFIWGTKIRASTCWFLALRYLGLGLNIATCVLYFAELSFETYIRTICSQSCTKMQLAWKALGTSSEILVECTLIMRVFAMHGRNWWILYLYCTTDRLNVTVGHYQGWTTTDNVGAGDQRGLTRYRMLRIGGAWSFQIACDILVFLFTARRAYVERDTYPRIITIVNAANLGTFYRLHRAAHAADAQCARGGSCGDARRGSEDDRPGDA